MKNETFEEVVRRPYETPVVHELGKVAEVTRGRGTRSIADLLNVSTIPGP